MKNVFTSFVLLGALACATLSEAATTPEPGNRIGAKTSWIGKLFQKKKRPPVLPYERALRRNEVFRS